MTGIRKRTVMKLARRRRRGDVLLGHRICKIEEPEAFGVKASLFLTVLFTETDMVRSFYIIVTEIRNVISCLGIGFRTRASQDFFAFPPVTKGACHGFESKAQDDQVQGL